MASSASAEPRQELSLAQTAGNAALIAAAIAAVVVAGRYLINPFFRLLAWTGDDRLLVAGGHDHVVRVWRPGADDPVAEWAVSAWSMLLR